MVDQPLIWQTRPRDDSVSFANELKPHGIESIVGSVLHIATQPITQIHLAEKPEGLLITSRHATHALASIPPSWRGLPTYCVGNATGRAAKDHGMTRIISGDADVLALLPRIAVELGSGNHLLHLSGDEGRADIKKLLGMRGIEVTTAVVYYATAEHELGPEIREALSAGRVRGVALFSPRTAHITCELLEKAGMVEYARTISAYCFSLNVAAEAGRLPWESIHTCPVPTRRAMRELIVSHFGKSL